MQLMKSIYIDLQPSKDLFLSDNIDCLEHIKFTSSLNEHHREMLILCKITANIIDDYVKFTPGHNVFSVTIGCIKYVQEMIVKFHHIVPIKLLYLAFNNKQYKCTKLLITRNEISISFIKNNTTAEDIPETNAILINIVSDIKMCLDVKKNYNPYNPMKEVEDYIKDAIINKRHDIVEYLLTQTTPAYIQSEGTDIVWVLCDIWKSDLYMVILVHNVWPNELKKISI